MSQQVQAQDSVGQYKISKWLYRPYQVLFFDTEDLALLSSLVILGFLFGGIFWLLIPIGTYLFIRIKRRGGRGAVKHFFYMIGFFTFKGCPSVFEKKFWE